MPPVLKPAKTYMPAKELNSDKLRSSQIPKPAMPIRPVAMPRVNPMAIPAAPQINRPAMAMPRPVGPVVPGAMPGAAGANPQRFGGLLAYLRARRGQ